MEFKSLGCSLLACGNSSLDLIHCCALHIVINTLIISDTLKEEFPFSYVRMAVDHGSWILLLCLQKLLGFFRKSRFPCCKSHCVTLQAFSKFHVQCSLFISFYLFFIFLLDYYIFVKKKKKKKCDDWQKEKFGDDFFGGDFLCFELPKY